MRAVCAEAPSTPKTWSVFFLLGGGGGLILLSDGQLYHHMGDVERRAFSQPLLWVYEL